MFQQKIEREFRTQEAIDAERATAQTPENTFRDLYLAAHAAIVQLREAGAEIDPKLNLALNRAYPMLRQLGVDVPEPPITS